MTTLYDARQLPQAPRRLLQLYTFGGAGAVRRLASKERGAVVFFPLDHSLVPHNQQVNSALHEVVTRNVTWCGIGEVTGATDLRALEIPGYTWWKAGEPYVFALEPVSTANVFVVNNAPYSRLRQQLQAQLRPREALTEAQLRMLWDVRAATLVPIDEYTGGYEQPFVIFAREIWIGEVTLVGRVQ